MWLQAGSHPATNDRLLLEALLAPPPAVVSGAGYGVVGPGDLAVTQNGTPNMSVNVAAGKVFVDGTENAVQGAYLGVNDATVNLAISASDPTNPRKDLVVARVQDAEWSGATNSWSLAVITGTPAASPAEPAVPANAHVLALVDVDAGATSITNAKITDRRRRASALGGIVVCTSVTRPTTGLYEGLFIFETDTDRVYFYTGAAWKRLGLTDDPPACRLKRTGVQAIGDNNATLVIFDAEDYDPFGMHDNAVLNTRCVFPEAGVYDLTFSCSWAGAADYLSTWVQFRYNGNPALVLAYSSDGTYADAGANPGNSLATDYKFAAGDFVEVVVYQNNTANAIRNLNVYAFTARWVGRG